MRKTLTAKAIESLPAAEGGKRYDVLDAVVSGFGVRVMPTGRKSYFLLARFPGQKNPTRRTIAPVGRIELAQARETARGWLSELVAGADPAMRAAEKALTVAQAVSKTFCASACYLATESSTFEWSQTSLSALALGGPSGQKSWLI
jgi:hypothetical protein